jgi:hypothetical protein
MSKVGNFIGMEDDFRSFFVGEGNIAWSNVGFERYSKYFLGFFVPDEDARFFDIIIGFSEIMFVWQFSFAFDEVALGLILFDFSNVDPFGPISIGLSLAEDVILQYFFVFWFGQDGIKRTGLFNSSLFAIMN